MNITVLSVLIAVAQPLIQMVFNNYSNKFTPEEEVQVTLIAYNKGIGTTEEQIAKVKECNHKRNF